MASSPKLQLDAEVVERAFAEPQRLNQHGQPILNALALAALRQELRLFIPQDAGGFERIANAPLHSWPEIFVQLSGRGQFRCAHDSTQLRPGDIILVPPGTPHHEQMMPDERGKPGRQLVFMCQEDRLGVILAQGDARQKTCGIAYLTIDDLSLRNQANQIAANLQKQRPSLPAESLRILHGSLLGQFFCDASEGLSQQQPSSVANSAQSLVRRCQGLVTNSLSDHRLSVASIANRLGLSADYCSHRFAAESGEHLSAYINRLRCRHAAHLLTSGDLKISAIAWACGYADSGYFARVFAGLYGLRPRAYRNQRRN